MDKNKKAGGLARWTVPLALALVSVPLFFFAAVDFVPPGDIARLEAMWLGYNVDSLKIFPLMGNVAKLTGMSNIVSPVCATLGVLSLYFLVCSFIGMSLSDEFNAASQRRIARAGGLAAALVYMFSTALSASATHIEPRLFDVTWAMLSFVPFVPYARRKGGVWGAIPLLCGAAAGVGAADSAIFILILPLYAGVAWAASAKRGGNGYGAAALALLGFAAAFCAYSISAVGDFEKFWDGQILLAKRFGSLEHWYAVIFFSVTPFIVTLFSARKAFSNSGDRSDRMFHAILTILLILATCTSLSPDAIVRPLNIPALFSTVCAAFACGCVIAYWCALALGSVVPGDARLEPEIEKERRTRFMTGVSAGGFMAFVLAVSSAVNRFVIFDPEADDGAFVDRVCEKIVEDLDGRTWFVSDGSFDDNLMLAAARKGVELHIVNLRLENDPSYIDKLAETVRTENLCPEINGELVDILCKYRGLERRRLVPFLQKWFASDPDITRKAAVFGAPDIWLYANVEPVPEFLFFGGDASRSGDWSRWKEFDGILHAPAGWGSWKLYGPEGRDVRNGYDRLRLALRRHLGLVANNAGYAFQEKGLKHQTRGEETEAMECFDKAFEMYELVLNEIDPDNFCSVVNEMQLARSRHKKSGARVKDLNRKLEAIYKDEKHRFRPSDLTLLYGYICDSEYLARYGYALLRSGRSDDAMKQFKRALDFIPEENRKLAELTLAASYHLSRQNGEKAREAYTSALAIDASNKNALLGLSRLSAADGDTAAAREYLSRIPVREKADPDVRLQAALLAAIDGDLAGAKKTLRGLTDADASFMQAWALLASVVMQQIDQTGDVSSDGAKKALKESLEAELEVDIIPSMEKNAASADDYSLLSTKAFALLRKGGMDNMKTARDSFIAASKNRPDIRKTGEFILDIDIRMNDTEDAKRQAVQDVAVDPEAPLANYVLGSLALKEDNLVEAEKHLRTAVAAKNPSPLALNDLAETLRRVKNFPEAEKYARMATAAAPKLYVAWDTLGTVLMDSGKNFDEAEICIQKACDLSKDGNGRQADVRMLVSLARVQIRRGENLRAKGTLRGVLGRIDELSEFEKQELEELRKSAR